MLSYLRVGDSTKGTSTGNTEVPQGGEGTGGDFRGKQ